MKIKGFTNLYPGNTSDGTEFDRAEQIIELLKRNSKFQLAINELRYKWAKRHYPSQDDEEFLKDAKKLAKKIKVKGDWHQMIMAIVADGDFEYNFSSYELPEIFGRFVEDKKPYVEIRFYGYVSTKELVKVMPRVSKLLKKINPSDIKKNIQNKDDFSRQLYIYDSKASGGDSRSVAELLNIENSRTYTYSDVNKQYQSIKGQIEKVF